MHQAARCAVLAAVLLATGCAQPRLLGRATEPEPGVVAATEAAGFELAVDDVIYRNGPGSWARNARWDEYALTLANTGDAPVQVERIALVDSLGDATEPAHARRALVKGTKRSLAKHRRLGFDVAAGAPPVGAIAGGVALVYGGAGVTTSVAASSFMSGTTASSSALAAGAGIALGGVALVGYGVYQLVQNGRIDDAIAARALTPTIALAPGETVRGSAFFPMVPAPASIEVTLRDAGGGRRVVNVPLSAPLAALHLRAPAPDRQ